MAMRAGELEPRHIERLRVELVEVIAAAVAYPTYFDFRANTLAMRPIDRAKMAEIEQFVGSANFSPIERTDPTSPELRRFLERLIQRYVDVNPSVQMPRYARQIALMRNQASRAATDLQRRFTAFLAGKSREFGTRKQALSWSLKPRHSRHHAAHADAHSGRLLETALQRDRKAPRANPQVGAQASYSPPTWREAPADATIPVPATSMGYLPEGAAGNEGTGAHHPRTPEQGGAKSIADQPTGPMSALSQPPSTPHPPMRELPPDLYQLYSGYLADLQPATQAPDYAPGSAQMAHGAIAPKPRVGSAPARPPSGATYITPPTVAPSTSADPRSDQLIFWQLRYQLEAYVRRAARSYGLAIHGGDPANLLDELRRSGFVDEADLRLAEGVFALTDRVTAQGHASADDYRQALMLYLLYHRSHLGA